MKQPEIWGILAAMLFMAYIPCGLVIGAKCMSVHNGKREQFWTLLAVVFFGMSTFGLLRVIGEGFGYEVKPSYTWGFGICFWLGQLALTVPSLIFTWHILVMDKAKRPLTPEAEGTIRRIFEEPVAAEHPAIKEIRKIFADRVTAYFRTRPEYFGDDRSREGIDNTMTMLKNTLDALIKYDIHEKAKADAAAANEPSAAVENPKPPETQQ